MQQNRIFAVLLTGSLRMEGYGMDKKRHFREIDSLKGWAIFLVILGHAIILFPVNLHEIPWCASMFAIISCAHMPLFFLVSGMCYSYKGDYKAYITKKVKRLIIPYIVFAILELAAVQLASGAVRVAVSLLSDIKGSLLYGGGYWFLIALFVIFLIYPILDKLINKNKYVRIICFVLMLVLYIASPDKIKLFQIGSALKYLFWFSLGVYVRRNYSMETILSTDQPGWKTGLKIALFAVLWIGIFCAFKTSTELALRIKDLFVTIAGLLCSFMLIRTKWFNDIFARFGKYSLQLYLVNCFALGASRLFVCNVLGVESAAIIIAFNMLVDFIIAYLVIKYICERIKPVRIVMGMI